MNEPIAIVNLIVMGLTTYVTYQGFIKPAYRDHLIFEPIRILRDKQYHRLVSSGFLHSDWMHFGFNMFSLYAFGSHIELIFGFGPFLLIYFASILGGSFLSLYLHRNHDYRALGASGGVCGVIFAAIFLLPGGGISMIFIPISIPAWLFAILFLFASFVGMRDPNNNIGHDAHLGGALIGLLAATVMYPRIIAQSPLLYASVLLIAGLLFYVTYKYPAHLQMFSPLSPAFWRQLTDRAEARQEVRKEHVDRQTLDELLDKVSERGIDSLTKAERKRLESISKRRNQG